jgi:hypothetical protein
MGAVRSVCPVTVLEGTFFPLAIGVPMLFRACPTPSKQDIEKSTGWQAFERNWPDSKKL